MLFFGSCPRSFDEPLFLKWSFCGMEKNVVSILENEVIINPWKYITGTDIFIHT
jgi:hypothetical protein